MRLNCVAIALCLLAEAFAQTPPAPDAILIAGASPASNRATDAALTPQSLALAPDGTLYLADQRHVWRVDTAGVLSVVPGPWEAGSQGTTILTAIAADAGGNLFVAEWIQHQIWRLTPQGAITTIAGLGTQPPDGSGAVPANSVAIVATSLAVDLSGNIFFSGNTARVWKISPDGLLRPFAGTGLMGVPQPTAGPVPALQYGLIYPGRLAADRAGNVYINDASAVVRVAPDGMLRQIRTGGSPIVTSLAVDGSGNLYGGLSNNWNWAGQVARIAPDGTLQIFAGTGNPGFSDGCTDTAPGVPLAIQAAFNSPSDLAADSAGNLYIADAGNGRVRKITRDGQIHTVAGGPGGSFGGDGGPAANAFLAGPAALALDSNHNLYFIDRNNNRVRRIDPGGIIRTVAGSGATAGQDPACIASNSIVLSQPSGLAVDPDGNVYIGDTGNHRILKLGANGSLAQVAGTGVAGSDGDGGPAAKAQLNAPTGLVFGFGNLYIAERDRIRYLTADGTIHTFYAPVFNPTSLTLDAAGDVFVANLGSPLELVAGGREFALPGAGSSALATGPSGEIYSAGGGFLSRLDTDCTVTPLTGFGNDLGGIAIAPGGDLYVSDPTANRIWRIPGRAPGGGSVPMSLQPAGIVNGATLRPRSVAVQTRGMFGMTITVYQSANENPAPGEIVAINGMCLGPLRFSPGTTDSSGRLATAIGDIQVLFNGVAAPLLSASPNQLIAVVPYEMAGASSLAVQVQYHGQRADVPLDTAVTSVGIFPVANATFARGSTVSLSITGGGQTNPPGVTGQVAGNPTPQPAAAVQVKVGGVAADVLSAAADPGTIGVTRVAFRIPPGLSPGPATITVTVGPSSDSISARLN